MGIAAIWVFALYIYRIRGVFESGFRRCAFRLGFSRWRLVFLAVVLRVRWSRCVFAGDRCVVLAEAVGISQIAHATLRGVYKVDLIFTVSAIDGRDANQAAPANGGTECQHHAHFDVGDGLIECAMICYSLSRDTTPIGVRDTQRCRANNLLVRLTPTSLLNPRAHAPATYELLNVANAD